MVAFLSLSLFLCALLFVVPLAVLAPPPSSSRLIVLSVAPGLIRIFITHFSPRYSFLEEAPCSVHALAILRSSTDSFLLFLLLLPLLLLLVLLLLFYSPLLLLLFHG